MSAEDVKQKKKRENELAIRPKWERARAEARKMELAARRAQLAADEAKLEADRLEGDGREEEEYQSGKERGRGAAEGDDGAHEEAHAE